ncbi:L,D-transpeptidase [Streptomyces sp. NPDC000927]|uniref:L,D-transpeptidase n=1 Tax=Streptomyces sp. NPDC000927 TaxID=3154371 RepID=UPI0033331CCA
MAARGRRFEAATTYAIRESRASRTAQDLPPRPRRPFGAARQRAHAVRPVLRRRPGDPRPVRDLFDGSGSAGCVNLRLEHAKTLWDRLGVGDQVYVWGLRPGT